MLCKCKDQVQGIGVTPFEDLPVNPQIFTEISIPETEKIPKEKPNIDQLMSVTVDAEVLSERLIRTSIGTSNEGQALTGNKLIIELKLRQKIKYIACEPTQSVHAAHFEKIVSSVFIVVPPVIAVGGAIIPIETAFNQGRIVVTPYVEDIYAAAIDKRTIFKNIVILVNVTAR